MNSLRGEMIPFCQFANITVLTNLLIVLQSFEILARVHLLKNNFKVLGVIHERYYEESGKLSWSMRENIKQQELTKIEREREKRKNRKEIKTNKTEKMWSGN